MSRMLSLSETAELTGMAVKTVKKRLAHLQPQRGAKGAWLFESDAALAAVYLYGDSRAERLDPSQEKAQLDRSRRRLADMQAAERAKELLPAAMVRELFGGLVGRARARLLALPSKVAWQCAAATDPVAVQQLLDREVYEALSQLGAAELPEGAQRRAKEIQAELEAAEAQPAKPQ